MTKPSPQVGDIWSWAGDDDAPYLLLEPVGDEKEGIFLSMCLADGCIRKMFFVHVMDYWEKLG